MDIPVTFSAVKEAYSQLEKAIEKAFELQLELEKANLEKAEKWNQLCANPDFKPGRSNLDADAKLGAAYPLFMAEYNQTVKDFETAKNAVEIARIKVQGIRTLIDLGMLLVGVQGAN